MIRTKEHARVQPGAGKAKDNAAKHTAHPSIKQRAKRLIVVFAVWGVLPIRAADLLIRSFHLGAE